MVNMGWEMSVIEGWGLILKYRPTISYNVSTNSLNDQSGIY